MSKTRKVWLCGVILAILATNAIGAGWSEPGYKGRSLTRWLQQCYNASMEETQKIAQAHQAINAIGAEKALPVLMEMIKAKDGKLRSWVNDKSEKWDISALKMREAAVTRQLGVSGFEALGTNAAPAVAELTAMLSDTNRGPERSGLRRASVFDPHRDAGGKAGMRCAYKSESRDSTLRDLPARMCD